MPYSKQVWRVTMNFKTPVSNSGCRGAYTRLLDVTYKKAPRAREQQAVALALPLEDSEEGPF
jgi:hypothetical protein